MSRELDEQVAEKVMGWIPLPDGMMHGRRQLVFRDPEGVDVSIACGCTEDFNPSTDIQQGFMAATNVKADAPK